MKAREPAYSAAVEEILDQREIDVECWKCSGTVQLTLHWISTHREMCCPDCGTLIILNTSRLQGEVTRLRRQLSALHAQMSGVLTEVKSKAGRIADSDSKPRFKPALANAHPDKLSRCVCAGSALRTQRCPTRQYSRTRPGRSL